MPRSGKLSPEIASQQHEPYKFCDEPVIAQVQPGETDAKTRNAIITASWNISNLVFIFAVPQKLFVHAVIILKESIQVEVL